MLYDLIQKNRSYRRFYQDRKIERETLMELVDLARLSPSPRNKQALKYFLSSDEKTNSVIFPTLAWAGYLKEWNGPEEGERPSAYIIILTDKELCANPAAEMIPTASGIASQSILLGAVEKGLGGCIIANVSRPKLCEALNIDTQRYEIVMVLALGVPKEIVVIEEIKPDGDVKYWRDENQTHYVPKRSLDEVIV